MPLILSARRSNVAMRIAPFKLRFQALGPRPLLETVHAFVMTLQSPPQRASRSEPTLHVAELEYPNDSARLFRAVADLPWPVWLDSATRAVPDGRYDILAADPSTTIRTRGAVTEIAARDGRVTTSRRPPFELLREQ